MTRIAPGRRAAYAALRAVNAGRVDLPDALARTRERLEDHRDQALAATIAAGTLRWRGALDHVIAVFARRPVEKLDAEVLDVLRLGAFQLLHLDRVPARAVIDDGVELVREQRKSSAAGFVNALLRRVDRERASLPLPPRPAEATGGIPSRQAALDYLSITLSHPRWLVARWLDRLGFDDAEAWARFNNAPAPLTLRANTLKTRRDALAEALATYGVRVEPTRFSPDGLTVVTGQPLATPLAAQGAFFVQDEASQLVALAAAARPGERVLDACASPGGKTAAMAAAMEDRGAIVAGDARRRRIDLLNETISRCGARCVRVARLDAAALPFNEEFDLVLLDAPCSGLGTIRRDPEIRWRRVEADLAELAAAQRRFLAAAARAVRPGGRVLYSTCSSEPDENEAVVGAFLSNHRRFTAEPVTLDGLNAAALLTPEGFLRTRPDRHGLEAFFAAVVRRIR